MTAAGVAALRTEIDLVVSWASRARAAGHDFTSPSNLPGWSHWDVLAHLDELFDRVVDPAHRPSRDDDVARRAEDGVAARRAQGTSVADLVAHLAHRGHAAADALDGRQVPVAGDLLLHFGSAGQHPTHLWADGLVHELVVHRTFDLGVGGVDRDSVAPAVAWMVSALPQIALEGLHRALTAPVAIRIGAPVGAPITLWRVGAGVGVGDGLDGPRAASASVVVDPVVLLRVTAGRSAWRDEPIELRGDVELAAAVLDAAKLDAAKLGAG